MVFLVLESDRWELVFGVEDPSLLDLSHREVSLCHLTLLLYILDTSDILGGVQATKEEGKEEKEGGRTRRTRITREEEEVR